MSVLTTAAGLGGYDLGAIVLKGAANTAELRKALSDWPKCTRGIAAASTLTITLDDHHRTLADSPMFADHSFADYDALRYELVGVSKSGDALTLTFEDSLTCALRRQTSELTIPAGTQTRGAILERLFSEAGVRHLVEPNANVVNSAVERKDGANSWDLTGTLASAIGWRRFSDGTQIICGSDDWLATLNPGVELREFTGAVHTIDWELDVAQPANRASVEMDVAGWALNPGQPVTVVGQGMANGAWLVETIDRSEGITRQGITLVRRQLVIPEPPPEADGEAGEAGNLPTNGNVSAVLTPGPGKYGSSTLTAEQVGNAVRIAKVAVQRNLGNVGAALGIMCALQESSLRNLAGGDRDSVGLFQQRPSQGWGTRAQIMVPEYAAGKFYDALVKVPAWASASRTKVIQAVQRSATPDAYGRWADEADALVAAMISRGADAGAAVTSTTGQGKVAAIAVDLASKGLPYVYGGKDPARGLDCSGFVAEVTRRCGKVLAGASQAQFNTCQKQGRLISVQQALNTKGALLFRMNTKPTHVAVSLGDGRTAEARGKAYGVKVFSDARSRSWTHGASWS